MSDRKMIRKREKEWSLLRRIISIADSILKLLCYYFQQKTILSLCVLVIVVCVPVFVVLIVESRTSKDLPTLPPEIDVNPEEQVKSSDEFTPEEPKEIQKDVESGTQHMQDSNISEQLKEIREGVKSGTQRDEDMYQKVKAMNEDAQKMKEKVKKMKEKVDGQSEN